jgi:hypothetical protein
MRRCFFDGQLEASRLMASRGIAKRSEYSSARRGIRKVRRKTLRSCGCRRRRPARRTQLSGAVCYRTRSAILISIGITCPCPSFQKTMQWPWNSAMWTAAASMPVASQSRICRKLREISDGLHSPYRGPVGFLGAAFGLLLLFNRRQIKYWTIFNLFEYNVKAFQSPRDYFSRSHKSLFCLKK